MRHIKLRARLVSKDRCMLSVVEQSHRNDRFGGHFGNVPFIFYHDKIAFASDGSPACYNSGLSHLVTSWKVPPEIDLWVFLRGRSFMYDDKEVPVSASRWPEIKVAVEAYNKFYKDRE